MTARNRNGRNSWVMVAVYGSGRLPLDCLRYDSCVPEAPVDAHEAQDGEGPRLVILRCYARTGHVTVGRWRSFGWRVVDFNFSDQSIGADGRMLALRGAQHGLFLGA